MKILLHRLCSYALVPGTRTEFGDNAADIVVDAIGKFLNCNISFNVHTLKLTFFQFPVEYFCAAMCCIRRVSRFLLLSWKILFIVDYVYNGFR